MDILSHLHAVKRASQKIALLSDAQRNAVLQSLAAILKHDQAEILAANANDLAAMHNTHPMYDRLLLTADRLDSMIHELENVIALPSPLHRELSCNTLPNGLNIKKITVPLGVVAVIYESRPNVTIDVFSLCFKSGNACVLKGGKEAYHTNQALFTCIQLALEKNTVDANAAYLFSPQREATTQLLEATGLVDVCIPRGSQSLIDFVRQHAKIPVIETGAGIVHTYFDKAGDTEKGALIINNAKTRRVSVCNALDCLLIHSDRLADLPTLLHPLQAARVEIFADSSAYQHLSGQYPDTLLHHAQADDYGREFLSHKMAIKTVASLDEAITHIMRYTSGHSEAIITEDSHAADNFIQHIDAAAVYVNTSTAFTDGAQFGLGAEIGISTQKLHARGPMGLEALTSYKWVIRGNGQIRP